MIKMIAAISKNNQIGIHNHMPWDIPDDLKYFKAVTSGYPIVMGRKTFESIGRPLPNRQNIVLTTNPKFIDSGIHVFHTIEDILSLHKKGQHLFIIGGGEIYHAFLPYADELYLTLIDQTVIGDTSFPDYRSQFECTWESPIHTNPIDGIHFTFTIWKRKNAIN